MARRVSLIPLVHLVVGVAMTLLIIIIRPPAGDPVGFMSIANKTVRGLVAYRDYPVEYPPLGLVHIALPRLMGGPSPDAYQDLFSLLSLALAIGTAVAVLWLARRRWAVETTPDVMAMFVGLALAGAPLVVWRFDILPAFLTVVALVAYVAGRNGWSGMSLGLGFAAKAYPAFLVPLFAVAELFERRWRDAAILITAAGVTVVLVFGEVFLAAGTKEFYFLVYERNRGVEVESIAGAIAMLGGALGWSQAKVSFEFGSDQVTSSLLNSLSTPTLVFDVFLGVVLVLAALWSFRRDVRDTGRVRPLTLVQYSLATVLVAILANKVLSPQYVIWLLPFVPLVSARKSLLFLVIVVLTVMGYPLMWDAFIKFQVPAVLVVNVRNVLLVALFGWVVWPALQRGDVREAANEPGRNPKAKERVAQPASARGYQDDQ